MGIIVDANAAHHLRSDDPAGAAILKWLLKGQGKLVVSKALLRELSATHLRSTLIVLERARRIVKADDVVCERKAELLKKSKKLKSDDPHIVALVIITLCDIVFTHDRPLHQDLKNRELIGHGCSIFQDESHMHLLQDRIC